MLTLLLAATLSVQTSPPSTAPAADRVVTPSATRTNAALQGAVDALAAKYPSKITTRALAQSAGGTAIPILTLASDASKADDRPAILVVAGLDGARWSGTEAALVIAENLATERSALLDTTTVYIVPRANPDAAGAFAVGPQRDYSGDALVNDNDRDRRVDENPPADLNGDGKITLMRVKDAVAPYANPTMVVDATDPRIMRAPDPLKGEIANYTVFLEGADMDGDGRICEDAAGGVVPDRNFPHRWPEFEDEVGVYPLCAPEAAALANFVIKHPTLTGALVIGRLDTVVNVPDGRARTETNVPNMIAEDDAKAYAAVAKLYRDLVGQTRATEADSAGSLVAWMNAQRGVPTFATQLWGRPDAPKDAPKDAQKDAPKDAPKEPTSTPAPSQPNAAPVQSAPTPTTQTTQAAPPTPGGGGGVGTGGGGGGRGGRGGRGGPPLNRGNPQPTASEKVEAGSPDDAAWLAINDAQGGGGFIAWTTVQHPQLGQVEIGGWAPGWRENPPLDKVQPLGDKCAAFVAALAEHRANVSLDAPRVVSLGPGLYQIEATLANRGMLPSIQQGGRNGDVTPAHVVRISPPVDRIKSGQRMAIVRGMGAGESRRMQWVVNAPPEEVIELELLYAGKPIEKFSIRGGEVIK